MAVATKPRKPEGRIPVHSIEFERALLCACLIDPVALVKIPKMRSAYFYDNRHRLVFAAMERLLDRGEPVDILTISDELRRVNDLEAAGGDAYVIGVSNEVATSANIEHYAEGIIDRALMRRLATATANCENEAMTVGGDVKDLMRRLMAEVTAIQDILAVGNELKLVELAQRTVANIMLMAESRSAPTTIFKTTFPKLDRLTGGLALGEIVGIAADTSMGKSDLMINLALRLCHSTAVGMVSAEMGEDQLGHRFIGNIQGLDSLLLRSGEVDKLALVALDDYRQFADKEIYIDFTPQPTAFQVKAIALRWKQRHKIKVLFIDNLTNMSLERAEGEALSLVATLQTLKTIARELGIAVVVLHHLNRDKDKRKESKPTLASLRYGGELTYDTVLMLWRWRHQQETDLDNMEIMVKKARAGKTGAANCLYELATGRIGEWADGKVPAEYTKPTKKEEADDDPF